jgi:hypothetical protein
MNELTIRASSLPDFADCRARWYAKAIEGKRTPSGPGAIIGKAIHASTALFDQANLDGSPIHVGDAADKAVDLIHHPEEDVDWELDDKWTPRDAEQTAVTLHTMYCNTIAPKRNYEVIEADLGAIRVSVASTGVDVIITGHTDRVRTHMGMHGVSDIKTGARAVSADGSVSVQGHAYQLAAYSLLTRANLDIELKLPSEVIGLNAGKTAKTQRVGVGQSEDIETTLLGTTEQPGLIHDIAWAAKTGSFAGNPRSMLCGEKYCPAFSTCRFRR